MCKLGRDKAYIGLFFRWFSGNFMILDTFDVTRGFCCIMTGVCQFCPDNYQALNYNEF